jgi:sec-independent protein translocase protein TatA
MLGPPGTPHGTIAVHPASAARVRILVIVILIFGANRLPEIGRGIGRGIRNFKDATKNGEGAEKAEKS